MRDRVAVTSSAFVLGGEVTTTGADSFAVDLDADELRLRVCCLLFADDWLAIDRLLAATAVAAAAGELWSLELALGLDLASAASGHPARL
jgi:hypothetical protein